MAEIKFYGENGLTFLIAKRLYEKGNLSYFINEIYFLEGPPPQPVDGDFDIFLFFCFGRSSRLDPEYDRKDDKYLVTFGEPDMIISIPDLLLFFEVKTGEIEPYRASPLMLRKGIWYEIVRFYYAGQCFYENKPLESHGHVEFRYPSKIRFRGLTETKEQSITFRYRQKEHSAIFAAFKKMLSRSRDFRVIVLSSDKEAKAISKLKEGIQGINSLSADKFDLNRIGWVGEEKIKRLFGDDITFDSTFLHPIYCRDETYNSSR